MHFSDRNVSGAIQKILAILAFSLFICVTARPADAHYLSFVTNSSTAAVGETHRAMLSFTHVFTEAQYAASAVGQDSSIFSANLRYNDGSRTVYPAFTEYDDPNGIEVTGNDSHISNATLSKAGTVILEGFCNIPMDMGEGMTAGYNGYAKQILNAASDGYSTRTIGVDVLEIVPLSDLANAQVGEEIQFKVLFKGALLAGAKIEWADEKSEVVMGDEGRENLAELHEPSTAHGVFTFTPRNAGMQFLGIMHTVTPGDGEAVMDFYSCAFIFEAKSADSSHSSSSGCSTAGAGIALMGILPLAICVLRGKR